MTPSSPPPTRHPAWDLLAHYRAVWKAAWAARHELAGPKRLADEAAFLPAALSLQDTPVHPAPRRVALVLCALFLIALLWSIFGQIDIVAVAHGRVIVSERSKTVQPLEASIVKQVLVKDGDLVQAGQVLVELDPTNASADSASVQEQLAAAESELLRASALIEALRAGTAPVLASQSVRAELVEASPQATQPALNKPDHLEPVEGLAASPRTKASTGSARTEGGASTRVEGRASARTQGGSSAQAQEEALVRARSGGPVGTSEAAQHAAALQSQLQAEWQDITARLAKLGAEHARRQAEMATVNASIAKLEATIPLARQRESDVKGLADQGFMSGHASQDRARERIELERDLATQRARRAEAEAALHESTQSQAAYRAETRRALSERQAQAHTKKEQLAQESAKARQRTRLTQLTAPTAGTVQQLAVHTVGGVVTPAQVLMVVVPKDAEVTAEVIVDNKDIGFVQPGQAGTIKLETFPFTRYGTLQATVTSIAADAVNDEKRGAIFPALLTLGSSALDVDGKRIHLSPGMNLTAEIKTGRRRIISYLFNPVQKAVSESLGER